MGPLRTDNVEPNAGHTAAADGDDDGDFFISMSQTYQRSQPELADTCYFNADQDQDVSVKGLEGWRQVTRAG